MNKPIKRHEKLKPLSRDHHHGLLLCWKIKEGIKKGVAPERIKEYTDHFWKTHLADHFKIEEQYIFPILGKEDELVLQALEEHRYLKSLFMIENDVQETLQKIVESLETHIRFEERVLFNKIQKVATEAQLTEAHNHHTGSDDIDNWKDTFWE